MKKILFISITFLITIDTFSQEMIFSNYFNDSNNWIFQTQDSTAGNRAIAMIDSNQLFMECHQEFFCPKAYALYKIKNNGIPEDTDIELKVSIVKSIPSLWDGDYNYIQLIINNYQIKILHSSLNYSNGCKLHVQISDTVLAEAFTNVGNEKINNLSVNEIESSDSISFGVYISACGPDAWHNSIIVIDTIELKSNPSINTINSIDKADFKFITTDNKILIEFININYNLKRIKIFSINGSCLYNYLTRDSYIDIDISDLKDGLYIMKIQSEYKESSFKILRK